MGEKGRKRAKKADFGRFPGRAARHPLRLKPPFVTTPFAAAQLSCFASRERETAGKFLQIFPPCLNAKSPGKSAEQRWHNFFANGEQARRPLFLDCRAPGCHAILANWAKNACGTCAVRALQLFRIWDDRFSARRLLRSFGFPQTLEICFSGATLEASKMLGLKAFWGLKLCFR